MRIDITILAFLLAGPALAANTPEQLIQELSRAAQKGDVDGFLAAMSSETRHVMSDADAVWTKLYEAQKGFLAALDERFGAGVVGGGPPQHKDRRAALSRFVDLALLGVEKRNANEALLRLKVTAKDSSGRAAVEENAFRAVEEKDEWKLDLTDLTRGLILTGAQRADAYERLTQEVSLGSFKDRLSAVIALRKVLGRRDGSTDR